MKVYVIEFKTSGYEEQYYAADFISTDYDKIKKFFDLTKEFITVSYSKKPDREEIMEDFKKNYRKLEKMEKDGVKEFKKLLKPFKIKLPKDTQHTYESYFSSCVHRWTYELTEKEML